MFSSSVLFYAVFSRPTRKYIPNKSSCHIALIDIKKAVIINSFFTAFDDNHVSKFSHTHLICEKYAVFILLKKVWVTSMTSE